jgi:hypothetical protein
VGCAVGVGVVSTLETLFRGDVDFRSTNKAEDHVCKGGSVSISCRNWHNLLYGGASTLETLLHGDANFHSTNEVEMLIVILFST